MNSTLSAKSSPPPKWSRALRTFMALLLGTLVGVVLASAFDVVPAIWNSLTLKPDEQPIFTPAFVAYFEMMISFYYSMVIVPICIFSWWGLGRFGRVNYIYAVGLGFLVTFAVYFFNNLPNPPDAASYGNGLKYAVQFGLAGAVAGFVTWRVAHPRRPTGS